jgi:hypothetical protein
MKEITVSPTQAEISSLLECAREEDVLLRTTDGSEFLLTAVDDFEEEIARTRENKELMALLDERRKDKTSIPWEEVKRELGLE